MNLFLKTLTALALIVVIIAGSLFILKQIGNPPTPVPASPQLAEGGTGGAATNTPPKQRSAKSDPRNKPQFTNAIEVGNSPIQPTYRPINQPAFLQLIRQVDKTYRSVVLGKLTGRASKTDWGLQGAVFFTYLYGIESAGKIAKNDGVTIVEERYFKKVQEELLISEYEVGIELGDRLRKIVDYAAEVPGLETAGQTVQALDGTRITIKKGWVDAARKAGVFKDLPQVDPEKFERELRMFTQGTTERLLENKTIRITFVDGQGIKTIEPINCVLSEKERDVIVRSNFALDHYVFPDRQVGSGEEWTVAGDTFSGFLDPRMSGKAGGNVTIIRTPDFVAANGAVSKKLKLTQGNIVVQDVGANQAVTGQLTSLSGVLTIPDAVHVVTSASLKGYADYQNVSTDHLLFEAKQAVKPKFEIQYQCTVE